MSGITKLYENVGVKKKWNSTPYGGIEEYYPPFTAEKQLELIKWFIHSRHFSPVRFTTQYVVDNIASCTNFLWQSLTEEEHKQVKEILE